MPVNSPYHLSMGSDLEATFVHSPTPALMLWLGPRAEETLEAAVGQVLGQVPARATRARLVWPAARCEGSEGPEARQVDGLLVPISSAINALARMPSDPVRRQTSHSVGVWSAATKLALELVSRQRVVPWADVEQGCARVRWRVAADVEDISRFEALADSLPVAARALAVDAGLQKTPAVMRADTVIRGFMDAVADAVLRRQHEPTGDGATGWAKTVASALTSQTGALKLRPVIDESLVDELQEWVEPALSASAGRVRLAMRLETPAGFRRRWKLGLIVVSCADPSLRLGAREVWAGEGPSPFPSCEWWDLQRTLIAELGRTIRVWPGMIDHLKGRRPDCLRLLPDQVARFITDEAPVLRAAGIEVQIPAELTTAGRRRLKAQLHAQTLGETPQDPAGFGLGSVTDFCWKIVLDGEELTQQELERLAELKQPLIRLRGQWFVLSREEIDTVASRIREGRWKLEGAEAVAEALLEDEELQIGPRDPLQLLRQALMTSPPELGDIVGFEGRLRPYQRSGAAWLERLGTAELGGVLADDMGLGKTVQVLVYLTRRLREQAPTRPSLLVCPMSVLGTWEREAKRFVPSLRIHRHYGASRASSPRALEAAAIAGTVCLTTYGLLRRDAGLLRGIEWESVILDEAQAIKNPSSKVAKVACSLRAHARFALTGTPVENRLEELWSIFRFVAPGLLGTRRRFRSEIAMPVERFRSEVALERLHRLTAPFLLRRTKTDPGVLPDLPPKIVQKSSCPLTREQATLYRAAIDDALDGIRTAKGMDRRGRMLALLTALKQICNHPELVLGGRGELGGRSGKLDRIGDEFEEILNTGEAALVFTQYRAMGDLLVRHFSERLSVRAPFLHGGVAQHERDQMVAAFQRRGGPPIMVISLRAGGTGLTLTRASHVYHFDRWWNPAVEEQASDRAHRIGQRGTVVVHPMVCRGTLEENIDRLLLEKAELASDAVRSGDAFLTELDNERFEELIRLVPDSEGPE